jgi:DNA-binding NtrC family response regulator
MTTSKILIVDDDPQMRQSLANLLRREGYDISECAGGNEAMEVLAAELIDLVITDLVMEPMSGLELLKQTKQTCPDLDVIVVSGAGTIASAVDAMKLKAFDFITKPFQVDEILVRVRNALEKRRLAQENLRLQQEIERGYRFAGIVGQSKQMQDLFTLLRSLAETDVTAIIHGETGTGKELIARAIHYNSPRRTRRFLAVNCGALAETLLESELFGHEKGAFTGATTQRKGIFEIADGGTLFLDEIGEMALSTQVKLLRVLQDGEFQRVGATDTIKVNVRVVVATNKILSEQVNEGRFRADLYYRLNVLPLRIPPLRERLEDVPLLVSHFIDKHNTKLNKRVSGVNAEASALLMAYHWPGNVRELENVIQRMLVIATKDTLDVADLPAEIRGAAAPGKAMDLKEIARETAGHAESSIILDALARSGGNVTHAAKALGISRATLQNKMKAYNLRSGGKK